MAVKTEVVKFEQIAQQGGLASVPYPYMHLVWQAFDVADIDHYEGSAHNGFTAVTDGHGAAYNDHGGGCSIGSIDTYFTLRNGHFASAYLKGMTVTFTAFKHQKEVGEMSVVLNQKDTLVRFSDIFRNVDQVRIATSGGTPTDSPYVAEVVVMDDLKIILTHPIHHSSSAHLLDTDSPLAAHHDLAALGGSDTHHYAGMAPFAEHHALSAHFGDHDFLV